MKPKKSLGQNFLKDKEVLTKIIRAANLDADDLVIEIGPGRGALSSEINKHVKNFIMIEKDYNLADEIARNFQFSIFNPPADEADSQSIFNNPILNFKNKAAVISGDILKLNLIELISKNNFYNYKVVANIPYYITSPIIQLFLETEFPPKEMLLTVQKEVAERICASPGNMSILAVSVQYYAKPKLLFYVDKNAFWPVPEVDSAVIKISDIKNKISKIESKKFFRVVKAGFCAKRKTLLNNLSSSFHLDKKTTEEKIKKAGINPGARAQELSVEDWKKLTKFL
ncbi:MAG TPA: 16S rRNA (adenine(1518)-N(6)/adenine(1519)-N(6))-dimethyltransferase RsmA [Candidatus Moranbacteria bacterium]|nr:16S rRNA (adenine(1518)-N(6)/adenine(1519)-N(6))-dimethyltransferase RsmA [Candidatus Moranbacteria bacterium]